MSLLSTIRGLKIGPGGCGMFCHIRYRCVCCACIGRDQPLCTSDSCCGEYTHSCLYPPTPTPANTPHRTKQRRHDKLHIPTNKFPLVKKFASNRGASIVGDVLLAAAFVSYAGAFSKDYRQELWRNRSEHIPMGLSLLSPSVPGLICSASI